MMQPSSSSPPEKLPWFYRFPKLAFGVALLGPLLLTVPILYLLRRTHLVDR